MPYLTYEGVFELEAVPRRLTVVGGGPVGCELAQALRPITDYLLLTPDY